MTRAFLQPIAQAEPLRAALAALIPRLETERLVLRAPELGDWDRLEPIWRSDRGKHIGGPYDEEDAFFGFANSVAGWLLRGVGYWTVTRKADGAVLGLVGLGFETTDPELEFGWLMTEAAEGQGYATEAGIAVRGYAFDRLGLATLISIIARENDRSIVLAKRLGATEDAGVVPEAYRDTYTAYRHLPKGPDHD
jgi:RimJ/RimL family protein N-acetyltransferase